MKKLLLLIIGLFFTLTLVGCVSEKSSVKEPSNLKGTVVQIVSPNNDNSLIMLQIDSSNVKDTKYKYGSIAVIDQTNIYDKKGNKVSAEYIKNKSKVEVVFSGEPIGENPVQALAKIIRITK